MLSLLQDACVKSLIANSGKIQGFITSGFAAMTHLLSLRDLAERGELAKKRVLIRADLNVPLDAQGRITEDTRIRASLPAIQLALEAGAAVAVMSHLGRPTEGQLQPHESLAPVAQHLSERLGYEVPLVLDWVEKGFDVSPGKVVLLENCRANVGEKANDDKLARKMAALCDVYVNDAFGAAHRAHASTAGIAKYAPIACAGPLLKAELDALSHAFDQPRRPLVAIVAGSKVSTKLTILQSLAQRVDQLIVGGGIANTFILAMGHAIGRSLAEHDRVEEACTIISQMTKRGATLLIPTDVVTAKAFDAQADTRTHSVDAVSENDLILDIGPQTAAHMTEQLQQAGSIIWNGPVGAFELEPFSAGTQALAQAIAASPAFSIAGGGDTLAAIARYGIANEIGYISTGGGAFLAFLEGKTLPAVAALGR